MELDTFFEENPDWRKYADVVAYPPLPEEIKSEFPDVPSEVLDRCMEPVSECGYDISRGAVYTRVRREDRRVRESNRWATMLSLQAAPGIKTTDTFWAGRKTWVDHFGTEYADNIKAQFAKKGINLTANQEYMPELVRPGYGPHNPDPEAIVPFEGARSYMRNLCEKRGWAIEGAVNVDHKKPDFDPLADENCVPIANDIIRSKAWNMIQSDESLKKLSRQDLKAAVLEKHGPSKVAPMAVAD